MSTNLSCTALLKLLRYVLKLFESLFILSGAYLLLNAASYDGAILQTCRNLIGPCVFNNSGRWPKRAGCSSSMRPPRANQATKSSCSGPTGRNSLSDIFQ